VMLFKISWTHRNPQDYQRNLLLSYTKPNT
jgi:hypothetical protein